MKNSLIALIMLFTAQAFAEPGFLVTKYYYNSEHPGGHGMENSDPRYSYSTLMMLFNNSSALSFEDVKGVYSGRCYSQFDSNTQAGLFVADGRKEVKKVYFLCYDKNEKAFDETDPYDIKKYKTWFWSQVNPVTSSSPLVGSTSAKDNDSTIEVRKTSAGIVAKATYNGASDYVYLNGRKTVYIENGDEYGVCIFTKKLE